jgi:hypothetical protein
MYSKGKPMTEPINEKAMTFYDDIKTTDKCKYSECSNEKLPVSADSVS